MPTDEELLKRYAGGERAALAELANRYEVKLLNLAWPMLRSRELALDAVQETWLRVVRYAGSFNGRSSVKTWLYRITINQCRTLLAASPTPLAAEPADSVAIGPANDPAVLAVKQEQADHLRAAVEALPPEARELILLCYVQGLTHAEAAEVLEIPIGTIKSRVHAALERLRGEVTS